MSLGCWLRVFLHGSGLTEDPDTALNRTVKVKVITEILIFPLQEQYYIKGLRIHTDSFLPVIIQGQ